MEYARMQQDLKEQQMKIIHEQKQIEAENRHKKSSYGTVVLHVFGVPWIQSLIEYTSGQKQCVSTHFHQVIVP